MNNFGELTIFIGSAAICISFLCYLILNSKKEDSNLRKTARLSFMVFTGFVTIGSCILFYLILNHEFIYSYVAQYSSRDLDFQYLISSFWAGQEGSFLLWVLLASWLGILLMFKVPRKMEPQVMLIYNLSSMFLMLLLIKQSPFQILDFTPADGNGMNMLLQDPWMVIHPPVVFLGYAAFTIPFAYSVSSMFSRDYNAWIKPALPWAVFAFVVLGGGIIIGGYWSYKVLGWGGYWGWDPVENASLLPWLTGIALIHGMLLQKNRKQLQKTNFVLAAVSFILVIYCTFLTRSGVLDDFSVHSFVDLGITSWLVLYMSVFLLIFLWLFVTRAKQMNVSSEKTQDSWFSKESGFIGAIILLSISTLMTGLGTSAPLITRLLEKASKVSTDFYVITNLPLAILMLLLLSVVPILSWGKNSFAKILPQLIWGLIGGFVSIIITLINSYPGIGVLLIAFFAGSVIGTNIFLVIKFAKKRITLCAGHIVHLGLGMMFIGIISSSVYDSSEKIMLTQGIVQNSSGYEIKLDNLQFLKHGKGTRLEFLLDLKQGNSLFIAKPDIYAEEKKSGQIQRFVHPYIHRGLISDLYISPVDFRPGQEKASKNHIDLEKSKTVELYDYKLTFKKFEITGMKDGKNIRVVANIEASYKGEPPVTLKPGITMDKQHTPESHVKLPGPENNSITLTGINANSKIVHIDYHIAGKQDESEAESKVEPPALVAEISIKPGMTILWVGSFLILFGGCIAIVRHRNI